MKWWINLLTLLVSCSAESSQCPGSKASCPVASTCCQIGEGILGCCPIQNAVCCEDSKHCCPRGYSCDVNRGVCKMGSKLAPLLKKILATPTSNEIASKDVVVCPGGEGQCPTDHSCCTVPGGNQLHCCPLGYSCDRGMCRETEVEFPAAMLITSPDKVVKCSQQFACPDRYTCCTRDSYQCCPLPEAVCCSDNKHCCPRGFKCSDDGKSCLSGSHSIVALSTATPKRAPKSLNKLLQQVLKTVSKEWLSRTVTEQVKLSVPMTVRLVEKVICPGGESFCPSGQTCCKVASGQWGCCPLSRAVCCSDGVHCCPHDYTCDLAKQTCERNSDSIAILTNTAALKSGRIICPDHISECPDNNTCCKLASEGWACCPLPNAVCCSDGEHCCPEGYTCDTSGGTCKRGMKTAPMLVKTLALKKTAQTGVVCPGGESQCPDDSTCCKLSSGEYGCCPLPNAVCCSDGEHCCPEGYTCDVSAGTCNHGRKTIALLHKIPAIKKIVKANIVCPDGSKCPSGSTCCQIASGGYGCCPLPDAVCCSDKVHCCPHGYTCDTANETCQKGMKTVPMLVKTAPLEKTAESSVICPDGKSQCPDGTTCCKLSSGEYGCCPLPNAVCCSDGEHCCPEGYTCDTSAGTCERGMKTAPMLVKTAALKKTAQTGVVCPDGESQCPDDSTCCKLSSGEYGCCPLPNAVCCSDGEHCCPEGYTCDTSAGTCNRGMKTAPMLVKIPALKKTVKVKMLQNNERRVQSFIGAAGVSGGVNTNSSGPVICPDKMYQCPDGNTCCKLHSGSYGCCPIEKAICCNDDKHCCPQGYKCDVKKGKCNKEGEQVSMIDNIPAVLEETDASPSYIECADGSKCLDYETCCEMSDGSYGCCPMPNAFCCEDKEHCCPRGYRCDRRSQSCVSGSKHVPMLTKTKSAHYRKTQEEAVDKKLHFSPGRPKDGKSVQSVDWL